MKESGLRIRVEPALRRSFIEACKKQDRTASQAIRDFMRRFVEANESGRQRSLFEQRQVEQLHAQE